ncbi:MAG TPA: hypothetical protein DCM68_00340, partial [Verrucomicrobia bacterium]|nr:hypothetical protein [Verrucomicrobiota bacterium]
MNMKQIKLGLAIAAGILAGALAWAAGSSLSPDSYAKVEAQSLVTSPQSAWARAILFSDVLESPPSGRPQRLNRKNYLPMKLKTAGTAWVLEDLALKFQTLKVGDTYSFAGTVDQISRRYYIIVDACYRIQTAEDMNEKWTDMLNPPAEGPPPRTDVSDTAMQALLLEAQNSLIQLAKESNMTVAQLIEAQTDGGQRIAEHIVADALQGELKAQNKTAEEMMIGSVLALLQKQAVLDESQKAAAEIPAQPEPAAPETTEETVPVEVAAVVEESAPVAPVEPPAPEAKVEELAAAVIEEPAPEEPAPVEPPAPEAKIEEPAAAVIEETATAEPAPMPEEPPAEEGIEAAIAEMLTAAPDEPVAVEEAAPVQPAEETAVAAATDEEKPKKKAKAKKKKKAKAEETSPKPAAAEEIASVASPEGEIPANPETAELILPAEGEEPAVAPPSSMLVVPLAGSQPEIVPMVSVEPTKAELARLKKQEAIENRNRERAEKKAAAEAAAQKKLAEKQARIEAKRLAIEARKAEE